MQLIVKIGFGGNPAYTVSLVENVGDEISVTIDLLDKLCLREFEPVKGGNNICLIQILKLVHETFLPALKKRANAHKIYPISPSGDIEATQISSRSTLSQDTGFLEILALNDQEVKARTAFVDGLFSLPKNSNLP